MKYKKVLLLLLLPYFVEGLSACSTGGCDDGGKIYQYTHSSIQINHIDNSGTKPVYVTSGEANKRSYGIRLSIDRDQVVSIKPTFSLFAPLYATDCAPNEYVAEDAIVSIKVTTLNDFDNDHVAGSDISAFFSVSGMSDFTTLDKYVDLFGSEIIYNPGDLHKDLDIFLMTPPELNTTHTFKVEVTLSDGRVIEETLAEIDLVE